MLTIEDKAWMAGVIDLKGRMIRKRNQDRRTTQTLVYVESKQHEVIRALSKLTGTKPEAKKQSTLSEFIRVQCKEHCPDAHIHVRDGWSMPTTTRWTITGGPMVVVMLSLLPYLRVDRGYQEAIDAIMETQSLAGQGAHAIWANIKRLMDLGWTLPEVYQEPMKAWTGLAQVGGRPMVVASEPERLRDITFLDDDEMMVVAARPR
jgi:hypothetical protein